MSKIKPLSEENKAFLIKHKVKLKDVAEMLNMKELSLINSTAKNRYINLLRDFCERIGV